MANKNNQVENEKELEAINGALSASEAFVEKNQKILLTILGAVLLIAVVWLAVKHLYIEPKEVEAQEQMAKAQLYLAQQQFDLALNGDSADAIGFAGIADEYSLTKSGNVANAYAGLLCYKMEKYDDAIEYLKEFSGKDDVLKYTVQGTIGDCYVQKGQSEEAEDYFKKAAKADNDMVAVVYAFKLARLYESMGQNEKALKQYQSIKADYSGKVQRVSDLDEIDKFIDRLSK